MKKLIAGIAIAALSTVVTAEDLIANGAVVTSCSFSNTNAGTLVVSGTSVTTGTKPTTDVLNNDPSVYDITVGNQGLTAPVGVSALAVNIESPVLPAGAASIFDSAAEADGDTSNLAAAGTYQLSADFTSTLAAVATAGSYAATVSVTCAPAAGGGEF